MENAPSVQVSDYSRRCSTLIQCTHLTSNNRNRLLLPHWHWICNPFRARIMVRTSRPPHPTTVDASDSTPFMVDDNAVFDVGVDDGFWCARRSIFFRSCTFRVWSSVDQPDQEDLNCWPLLWHLLTNTTCLSRCQLVCSQSVRDMSVAPTLGSCNLQFATRETPMPGPGTPTSLCDPFSIMGSASVW